MKKRNLILTAAILAALMLVSAVLPACSVRRNDPPALTTADAPETDPSSTPQSESPEPPVADRTTAGDTPDATDPAPTDDSTTAAVPSTGSEATTPPTPTTTKPESTTDHGPGTEQGTTPITDPAACEHKFGEWTVLTPATCAAAGTRTHKCTLCGKEETMKYSAVTPLDGKRVMFAGNSMLYYGEVVINTNGSPTSKKGIFEKVAESFGDKVAVTNFTYGSAGFFDG